MEGWRGGGGRSERKGKRREEERKRKMKSKTVSNETELRFFLFFLSFRLIINSKHFPTFPNA